MSCKLPDRPAFWRKQLINIGDIVGYSRVFLTLTASCGIF